MFMGSFMSDSCDGSGGWGGLHLRECASREEADALVESLKAAGDAYNIEVEEITPRIHPENVSFITVTLKDANIEGVPLPVSGEIDYAEDYWGPGTDPLMLDSRVLQQDGSPVEVLVPGTYFSLLRAARKAAGDSESTTVTIWRGETAVTVVAGVDGSDRGWSIKDSIDEDGNPVTLTPQEEAELDSKVKAGVDETGY